MCRRNLQDCQTPIGIMFHFQIHVLTGRWRGGWKRKDVRRRKAEGEGGNEKRPTLITALPLEDEDDGGRTRG